MSLHDAVDYLEDWLSDCTVLDEHRAVSREWLRLVERHKVQGKQVHDCNIVAVMKFYGVRKLATRNVEDFKRYGAIIELDAVP